MIKIKKITSFLEKNFPLSNQEKWDKSGLHYGSLNKKVNKVLVTLDLTKESYDYAIYNQIEFIIIHHPFWWEESIEEDIKKAPYKLKIHNRLLNSKISVYSLHTNYDNAKKGTSYEVAKKLGFKEIETIKTSKYSVILNFNDTIKNLNKLFNKKFDLNSEIKLNYLKSKSIKKFAIIAGSGSIEEILELKNNNIKTIVTSDVKWSDLLTLKDEKINLIIISHAIENVFVDAIKKLLKNKFKNEKLEIMQK